MSFPSYFRISSYAMIAVATGGLVLTGALHIGLALLFALLLLFAWFAEGTRRQLAERTGLVLVLFSLPIFYVDWTYQALPVHVLENGPGYNPLVGAIAHLIVFLSVIKLLQVKADRDWVFLYLISFFEILLAAGLSFSPALLALLIIYLVCALSTVIAFEIHKAKQNLALVETRLLVAPDAKIFRRLARKGNRSSVEVRRLPLISLGLLVAICALALPLFLVAPRGSAGTFAHSGGAASMFIGFSENVTLGEIGTLKQNDEIVMHVRIDGPVEHGGDLRWRGISLDEFTGKAWKKSNESRRSESATGEHGFYKLGTTDSLHRLITQTFYLEPMETQVVFAASRVVALQGPFPYLRIDGDDSLQSRSHGSERLLYKAISDTALPDADVLRRDARRYPEAYDRYHSLTTDVDPRITNLTTQVIFDAQAVNRYDKARAVEQYLQHNFGYSLQMKASGPDPLADFLLNVRSGHCEYFATAMAVMLRTQGIATRIVNGFLPGEFNEAAGAFTVRQSDAHSWVEVYFPETRSWVAFDPTPVGGRTVPVRSGLAATLGKYAEAFELIWFQYVVGYDKQEQRSLATSLNNQLFSYKRSLGNVMDDLRRGRQPWLWKLVYLIALAPLVLIGWFLLQRVRGLGWHRRIKLWRNPVGKERSSVDFYERLLALLESRGLKRDPDQTPLEFANATGIFEAVNLTRKYYRIRFGRDQLTTQEAAEIDSWLQQLEQKSISGA